jgi:cobalt-zinc-cadmium efflux system outer membrane protein
MKQLVGLTLFRSGLWILAWLPSLVAAPAQHPANSPEHAAGDLALLRQLSLADAQRIAFQRNWDLLAAVAGVDAATAQKIVAKEFPNPSFAFSTTYWNVDNHPNSTVEGNSLWDRSYDTVFAVTQLFEVGGKRRSRQNSAQAGFEAAKAQLLDAKRTLDLAVAKAYAAAALAQENVDVLRQSAASLRKQASIAEVRVKDGDISEADQIQIEISAERFELDARTAESSAAQARIALQVLLGVPHPGADCVLTDRLEALIASGAASATNSTGAWRPDVIAAEAAWRKAQSDIRLQRAYRIPDPTVLAQYDHNPPDFPNSIGFGVSFPLPLWNHNRGAILAAEAASEQARLAYEKARAQAVADIATALLVYDDAAKRWQTFRESIRPKSERVRKTKAYAYEKGGASLLDMLVAERDDNDVRLAANQAASDTAVALASLKAATQEIQPPQLKP